MFEIITKAEYWGWQDSGWVDARRNDLKGIQDAYIMSRLSQVRGSRILEVGGGNSRVLRALAAPELDNECWNADKFEGFGNGPVTNENDQRVRLARCFLGEFSPELPNGYFDYVISVSVIEHVPTSDLESFFADTARVLRPGGQILHAIDLYLFDTDAEHEGRQVTQARIAAYLDLADRPDLGVKLRSDPGIGESASFKCSYATNSDLAMSSWNKSVPRLRPIREIAQSVSLKAEWVKTGSPVVIPVAGAARVPKPTTGSIGTHTQTPLVGVGEAIFGDRTDAVCDLLAFLPAGLMVDVGAAAGHFAKNMLSCSPKSRVNWFEPFIGHYPHLQANVGTDDPVIFIAKAVADMTGFQTPTCTLRLGTHPGHGLR